MYTSLLTYILLTASNSSWITENSWNCLEDSLGYFPGSLSVSSDVDIKNVFGKPIYRMDKHILPKYLDFNHLLVYRKMHDWRGNDLRHKVIILTESLNDIDQLWTRFKIAHLLVLLQMNETCEIYTWFPYEPGTCHRPPELIHLTTCVNGKFPKALNFSFDEEYENTTGCPLVAALANCPLLVSDSNDSNVKTGPEVDILHDIAHQQGMVLVQKVQDPREYFTHHSRGSLRRNAHDLLRSREIDIAASCLSVGLSMNNFEYLPSHILEHMTWFFPGPMQKPVTFGAFHTLQNKVWIALITTIILIFIYSSMVHSVGFGISWTAARLFSVPTPPLGNSTRNRIISVLFELTMIIITASYKSMLLYNLFIDPKFTYKNAKEASEHDLTALIRPDSLIDFQAFAEDIQTRLFVPEKFKYVDEYDLNLLVVNRSVMLLGLQLLEQAIIRTSFPNLTYVEIVSTQQEAHAIVYISFFMPAHHPLHDVLSDAVLNVLEIGLPAMYIRRALAKLPGGGVRLEDNTRRPLKIHQVLVMFIMYSVLIAFSLLVFCVEMIVHRLQK